MVIEKKPIEMRLTFTLSAEEYTMFCVLIQIAKAHAVGDSIKRFARNVESDLLEN